MLARCPSRLLWNVLATFSLLCLTAPAAAEFTPQTGWSRQLFPSFIISTATLRLPDDAVEDYEEQTVLGDRQGLLGVTLDAPEDETPVTVTISCDAIMQPSVFTGTLATEGETYTIFPKIRYRYDVLAKRHQAEPITITYRVQVGDDEAEERAETLTLRSINDCPFLIVEGDDKLDTSFVFAAYVNEQHPFVDKILREALNERVVGAFTGYQSKDKAEVYRQVYALWHALSQRDLRYSDITTSAADSDTVASQHVRMIDESINNAQANCVDGSVLLASLLRKIGIEPVLVMVPGHCYLAFYLDREQQDLVALETTLLGSEPGDDETGEIEGLDEVVSEDWMAEDSWLTFTAALRMGTSNLQENAEQFKAGTDPDYQLINISAARKLGILPIAFQSDEKFIASQRPMESAIETAEDEEPSEEE